jgi:Fur family zinc uptake transcriptional regulator
VVSKSKIAALDRCYKSKHSITPQRMVVIDALINQKKAISAYDLRNHLDIIGKKLNIATIYRILGFWCSLNLVHRISSINKFIFCANPNEKHTHIINCCQKCEKIVESCHKKMGIDFSGGIEGLGLILASGSHLEVPVFCASCR